MSVAAEREAGQALSSLGKSDRDVLEKNVVSSGAKPRLQRPQPQDGQDYDMSSSEDDEAEENQIIQAVLAEARLDAQLGGCSDETTLYIVVMGLEP